MSVALKNEIERRVANLPDDLQQKVLDFILSLEKVPRRGWTHDELLALGGLFPPEDLAQMSAAIEEEFERIDPNDW